jgi:phage terminase Nu1 subunit (DNA packaging protein)
MVNSNVPTEELRWSLEAASREFAVTTGTLRKRMVAVGESADRKDHCYSTEQITTAIYGSIAGERLRETKERADNLALKNAFLRGDLLDKAELTKRLEPAFLAIRQIITASPLPKEQRDDLLSSIATIPIVVAEVAVKQHKQTPDAEEKGEEGDVAEDAEEEEEDPYQV